ncbi:hypothetical protein [Sunxiuqinia rutila]|uniref:hypothetical protein n=1 Tax=Sunxiuqinia rutila TaxID=1397841 RepID=UPI003D35BE55
MKNYLLGFLLLFFLIGCSSMVNMTSANMDQLELGMSKDQVTTILGKGYTIAEKRMAGEVVIEVLSYRDFYEDDEFYMFLFEDNQLKRWYRELLPNYEKVK